MYFHQSFFRAVLATLLFAASFALTGCGNDGSTVHEVSGGYSIDSGLAQKGPLIRGSSITINSLSTSSLKPSGASYNFETINNLGAFDPSGTIFTSKLIETTASGYYFNESTAKVSKDIVMLRGISDLITDRAVNVNVLTQIANRRTRQLFTTKAETTFAAARTRAQRELLSAFYIYNSADLMPSTGEVRSFSELDLSKARAADQILAAISAQITQVGQDGSGISVLLADLEADLADDGLLNNSGGLVVSPISQLWAVWGTVNWAQIALNLNGFYSNSAYKAADLSQWVDSSGGVDQVIDKFKYTAKGTVGTPSQSPAYVAGVDDAGQCFSVNAGKLYRNGTAVAQASVLASPGDSFKIEVTSNGSGATSGYIQRSVPAANGICPTVLPVPGLVRLQKYEVQTGSVIPVTKVSQVVAQGSFVGAIKTDNSLWTWGAGGGTNSKLPTKFGQTILNVANADSYVVYITPDLNMYGTGSNVRNVLLGRDIRSTNTPISAGFIGVAAGNEHVLALKSDGSLWAWGNNDTGQLGDGSTSQRDAPVFVGSNYKQIWAGDYYSIGRKSDGSLWGWGYNGKGQLGIGSNLNQLSPTLISRDVKYFSLQGSSSSMIKNDGSLWAWGDNFYGQLGTGTKSNALSPMLVGTDYIAVAVGGAHMLAIKSDGTHWSWGTNLCGNLGDGSTKDSLIPIRVGENYLNIAAGSWTSIGLKSDGTVWTWGRNLWGGIGNGVAGDNYPQLTPYKVDF